MGNPRLNEVAPANVGRIQTGRIRYEIACPLDHERRLWPTGAAIGVDHGGIGIGSDDLTVDIRNLVAAGKHPPVERRWNTGRDRRQISAKIRDVLT